MNSPASPTLDQWNILYSDQNALIKSPDGHQHELITLAEALRANGLIEDDELSDLLEQADAAYQWGSKNNCPSRLAASKDSQFVALLNHNYELLINK